MSLLFKNDVITNSECEFIKVIHSDCINSFQFLGLYSYKISQNIWGLTKTPHP